MKQRVHITESRLRNLVESMTRQMLSELDWKTYANAAKKVYKVIDNSYGENNKELKDYLTLRQKRFGNAAKNKFNDEYAYGEDNARTIEHPYGRRGFPQKVNRGKYSVYGKPSPFGYGMEVFASGRDPENGSEGKYYQDRFGDRYTTTAYYDDDAETSKAEMRPIDNEDDAFDNPLFQRSTEYAGYLHRNNAKPSYKVKQAFDRAADEANAYNRGRYEYVKGQGWQRKM